MESWCPGTQRRRGTAPAARQCRGWCHTLGSGFWGFRVNLDPPMQYLFSSPNKSPNPKRHTKPKEELRWRVQEASQGLGLRVLERFNVERLHGKSFPPAIARERMQKEMLSPLQNGTSKRVQSYCEVGEYRGIIYGLFRNN